MKKVALSFFVSADDDIATDAYETRKTVRRGLSLKLDKIRIPNTSRR